MPLLDHVYTAVHKTISLLPQAAEIPSGDEAHQIHESSMVLKSWLLTLDCYHKEDFEEWQEQEEEEHMDVLPEEVVQKQHAVVDADVVMIMVAVEVVKVIVILQEHRHIIVYDVYFWERQEELVLQAWDVHVDDLTEMKYMSQVDQDLDVVIDHDGQRGRSSEDTEDDPAPILHDNSTLV
ncbi:hypothetical protein ARMSODRAFT_982576 [Armillaria solidipes]|uniref:Uncharacterized protein n=1 Tax=Armillaria solidipes TaxID=1076256 RepID=A0A2H3B8F0_9AGAR|nr:hypothetical protein ARMSODRAFT_982576 [Armillaria solidipes]